MSEGWREESEREERNKGTQSDSKAILVTQKWHIHTQISGLWKNCRSSIFLHGTHFLQSITHTTIHNKHHQTRKIKMGKSHLEII